MAYIHIGWPQAIISLLVICAFARNCFRSLTYPNLGIGWCILDIGIMIMWFYLLYQGGFYK